MVKLRSLCGHVSIDVLRFVMVDCLQVKSSAASFLMLHPIVLSMVLG